MKRRDNIIDEFDQFTKSYTQDMIRWVPHYMTMVQNLANTLPQDFKPTTILDLGCGNGNATFFVHRKFPNATFHLLDASNEMLMNCKNRFPQLDLKLIESFFMEAKFENESFDLILASFSLHHLENKDKIEIFQRIKDWLHPNGIFAYTDLMVDREDMATHQKFLLEWEADAKSQLTTQEEWDWLMDHHKVYDFVQDHQIQKQWLEETGFTKVEYPWRINFWTNLMAIK